MTHLNARIQIEVLGELGGRRNATVRRSRIAKLFNVDAARADAAVALCDVLRRKQVGGVVVYCLAR